MEAVTNIDFVMELVRRLGALKQSTLAEQAGWDRAKAHRYLRALEHAGWLRNVATEKRPEFTLGQRVLGWLGEAGI